MLVHPQIEPWDAVDAFARAYIMLAIRVMKAAEEAGTPFMPEDLHEDLKGLREQLPASTRTGTGFVLDALVTAAEQFKENVSESPDKPLLTLVPRGEDDE